MVGLLPATGAITFGKVNFRLFEEMSGDTTKFMRENAFVIR